VADAGEHVQPRLGDAPGQLLGVVRRSDPVVLANDHQRRALDCRGPLQDVVASDGFELAEEAVNRLRESILVEEGAQPLELAGRLEEAVADQPGQQGHEELGRVGNLPSDVAVGVEGGVELIVGPSHRPHQKQAAHPGRIGHGQLQGDHAAERQPDEVGLG